MVASCTFSVPYSRQELETKKTLILVSLWIGSTINRLFLWNLAKFESNRGILSTQTKPLLIQSIEVSGVPPLSVCTACRNGTYAATEGSQVRNVNKLGQTSIEFFLALRRRESAEANTWGLQSSLTFNNGKNIAPQRKTLEFSQA